MKVSFQEDYSEPLFDISFSDNEWIIKTVKSESKLPDKERIYRISDNRTLQKKEKKVNHPEIGHLSDGINIHRNLYSEEYWRKTDFSGEFHLHMTNQSRITFIFYFESGEIVEIKKKSEDS